MGPALGEARGFRHYGTSRRQTPTSVQARRRAGNGEERGEPQRSQPRYAPALEPPQDAWLPPRLSQGPAVSSPPRESHSVSFAGPALGEAPASGLWGFRHHGTSRRQTPTAKALRAQPSARRPPAARGGSVITEPRGARRPPGRKHATGPGTGKSGGEPQRSQPRHAPALEPPASRGAYARLSQGPMVCYSRRALPAGRGPTVPQDRHRPPGRPL